MIYIVGAGLAGLAAAVSLSDAGRSVTVMEAAPAAGGRCRSYFDAALGCRIDNGNHLLLSGNEAAMGWLRRLGTTDTMTGPRHAAVPFIDLSTGERWVLRPGTGRVPFWLLDPKRRVPGTRPGTYLRLLRWFWPRAGQTVSDLAAPGTLTRRLIEPLAIAALNTMPDQGDAVLMGAVMRATLLRGGAACVPCFPRQGLSESLVDAAVALVKGAGAALQYGRRVVALGIADGRVATIHTLDGPLALQAADQLVLAVPAPVAGGLLPGLTVPDAFEAILNLHFRVEAPAPPGGFIGVVGGLAEWIFVRPRLVSVTVSAAGRHDALTAGDAAGRVWAEVCRVLDLAAPLPPHRVIRERRATFAATPGQARRRPATDEAGPANLALAGDWTATGLPATIEGALRSGQAAARLVLTRTPSP